MATVTSAGLFMRDVCVKLNKLGVPYSPYHGEPGGGIGLYGQGMFVRGAMSGLLRVEHNVLDDRILYGVRMFRPPVSAVFHSVEELAEFLILFRAMNEGDNNDGH
jgi:hypothetical protein